MKNSKIYIAIVLIVLLLGLAGVIRLVLQHSKVNAELKNCKENAVEQLEALQLCADNTDRCIETLDNCMEELETK